MKVKAILTSSKAGVEPLVVEGIFAEADGVPKGSPGGWSFTTADGQEMRILLYLEKANEERDVAPNFTGRMDITIVNE